MQSNARNPYRRGRHHSPRPSPTVHVWAHKRIPATGITVSRLPRAAAALLVRDGWQYCTRKQAKAMQL